MKKTPLLLNAPIAGIQQLLLLLTVILAAFLPTRAQERSAFPCPTVNVQVKPEKDTFKRGEDIRLTIMLSNPSRVVQQVWFNKPRVSTGGPAFTSVKLVHKQTGLSPLKYENKAILSSQLYTVSQIAQFSQALKYGEAISGTYSLFNLVVLSDDKKQLEQGAYEMQVIFCSNKSAKINFVVE
ncbi:hypothetical protein [Niabella beijingensis]|uniref:hypothetical protein n=1 Tax=Niabella beijingensis TaxID=2872700 RepID=UPI001CBFDE1C|nr:hypothetical protein [Niabella beijingensis]MBZ4188075.1 hypothetical protein [Niabella beijingensis]